MAHVSEVFLLSYKRSSGTSASKSLFIDVICFEVTRCRSKECSSCCKVRQCSCSPRSLHIVAYSMMLAVLYRLSRSEENTSELQSRFDLVCRLLLEKKNI